MRTPGLALAWELWRISRWDLILRTAMGAFFWSAAFYLMRANGDGPEPIAGFAFLMLVATSVFSAMWLGSFENREHRLLLSAGICAAHQHETIGCRSNGLRGGYGSALLLDPSNLASLAVRDSLSATVHVCLDRDRLCLLHCRRLVLQEYSYQNLEPGRCRRELLAA